MRSEKVMLLILDGWGLGQNESADAIKQAHTAFVDQLTKDFPNSTLTTFGEEVGLPEGQMGNSEVGHLNIGAGRIVYQELARINKALKEGELEKNNVLQEAIQYAKENDKPIHIMGLLSDGGVHAHINHLKGLCDILSNAGIPSTYLHMFMDGRDTDPKGGKGYLSDMVKHIEGKPIEIASVIGRYYAMDRDKRWERIKLAYDLMVNGKGTPTTDIIRSVEESYAAGDTDEFIKPIFVTTDGETPVATVKDGDVLLCFNFRTDRPRQISTVLTQEAFPEFDMKPLDLYYVTMARYDATFKNLHVLFEKSTIQNSLGEVLSRAGKTQVRIAETEKYPHVTYFFSGGIEAPFPGEKRILINSPKVATYDLQPEMSAAEVTDAIIQEIEANQPDFICLNYANADMVGHTGDFNAAIKAVETVDQSVERLVNTGNKHGYAALIIADHGNSDYMKNDDGTPNTAHTTNPVPCILVHQSSENVQIKDGKLADVAPTILNIMGIDIPSDMDGNNLIG